MADAATPRDPEELAAAGPRDGCELPASTTVGAVSLTVAELDRSLDYYTHAIGLRVLSRSRERVSLGAGSRELLSLVEEPGARPARGHTGLYHFALVVPERVDLARWLEHAARDHVRLVGLSDHFVSEALYLSDPDQHGIEIYWDRPRAVWEGQVAQRMTTLPLDVNALLRELDGQPSGPSEATYPGLPERTSMGHVHLRVADIPKTLAFYRDLLGFALMAQLGRDAAFLSAGGYHHRIGANTWESAGASPAPAGTAALRHATIVLPDAQARDRVLDRVRASGGQVEGGQVERGQLEDGPGGPVIRDPSGNALMLTIA